MWKGVLASSRCSVNHEGGSGAWMNVEGVLASSRCSVNHEAGKGTGMNVEGGVSQQ